MGRFFVRSVRRAWEKPPWAGVWLTHWGASSRALRSAACETRPRYAGIAALMSVRCRDASSKVCDAWRATIRSFCSTKLTRSARTFAATQDRKSTRLNSSHLVISYAVFCLKKKKTQDERLSAQLIEIH